MGATANRAIHWVEQGFVPDSVIRNGIRRLVKQRLAEIGDGDATQAAALSDAFTAHIGVAVVAPMPEKANGQHYEMPAAFFAEVLGAHRKYSACWWPAGVASLDAVEAAALARLRHSGARLPAPHLRRLRARQAGHVQLQAASSTYRIAMGPRAGAKY